MITINNFPFPPSVNNMYESHIKYVTTKKGRKIPKTYRRRSVELEAFYEKCYLFKAQNRANFDIIINQVNNWISSGKVLKLDITLIVEQSRIFTQKGIPKQFDSDNRIKGSSDGLSKILGIDDKYIFSVSIEKVSCDRKESECAIIKISNISPKFLENKDNQIKV